MTEPLNDQAQVLLQAAERLNRLGIPFMVTGSTAMSYYAMPRMTRDIDLVVEIEPADVTRLVGAFADDFYIDADEVLAAATGHGMFNVIHSRLAVKLDFVVRKESPYRREEFRRRRTVNLGGRQITLASVEDLILSKLYWAKDTQSVMQLDDVRNLLESNPDLDAAYLDRWARDLSVLSMLDTMRK
ncbi:MAG: nucleotidyl transferase AbiEii/AbiGii toxin family protein [Gammaproteobacteria bacterium]|nr:nucleotidyl transferase AbiEii/AbiGii toxin family protein [Gammaproteobacteria bacterium]